MTTPTPQPVDHDDYMALANQTLRLAEAHRDTKREIESIADDVCVLKWLCALLVVCLITITITTITITTITITIAWKHTSTPAPLQEPRP